MEATEGTSSTVHMVTASSEELQHYGMGIQPETLIEASFSFLLEREPKESILRIFNLPIIAQYFPDYPKIIRSRLG